MQILLGAMIAGVICSVFIYNCYNKREVVEKRLRQNIDNLEHNLTVMRKESENRSEQLESELRKLREDYKKALNKTDILQKDLSNARDQLDECRRRLSE